MPAVAAAGRANKGGDSEKVKAQKAKARESRRALALLGGGEGGGIVVAKVQTGFWRYQLEVRSLYNGTKSQVTVAVLIMINFVCNVLEKELDPQGVEFPQVWRAMEHSFNAIFLLELLINAYAHWLRLFWCSSWNVFDFIVVSVGCISFAIELEGPLKLLRTLRAFRVFRLFKRIKSLNKIIVMIISAIPGVTNAFIVMVLCISIYSLIAVEFFSLFGNALDADGDTYNTFGTNCTYVNFLGATVPSESARGVCYGEEYYGTFTRAWFSLFQVLTGESWAEVVARPILFGWAEYGGISVFIGAVFFITFVLVNAFILFNVFVAVLLDKVVAPDPDNEEEDDDDPDHPNNVIADETSPARQKSTKDLNPALASLSSLPPGKLLVKMAEMNLKLLAEHEERAQDFAGLNDKLDRALERLGELEGKSKP